MEKGLEAADHDVQTLGLAMWNSAYAEWLLCLF